HQSQGQGAGTWELNSVVGLAGTTATVSSPLRYAYGAGAQAVVVPQYAGVTLPATATLTAPPWNGTTGGILALASSGPVTVGGAITMTGRGFRGFSHQQSCPPRACDANPINGFAGESAAGPALMSVISGGMGAANGAGGGGGTY